MITDNETNFLYFSDLLVKRPVFFKELSEILGKHRIKHALLPGTRDIWSVDYMPIQKSQNEFIQFVYRPNYLENKKYSSTITDVDFVTQKIGLATRKINIKIDGGNVIKGKNWVIMTDKIFKENRTIPERKLLELLGVLFDAKPIIIPQEPGDYLGHSDGIVRYYTDDTLLINRYRLNDKPNFQKRLKSALTKEGFKLIEITYNPYDNTDYDAAHGFYINFLQMSKIILVPTFKIQDDENAFKWFQDLFPECYIETIDSREISKDGGVLNCISWNILQ